jgi:hypothetical protein
MYNYFCLFACPSAMLVEVNAEENSKFFLKKLFASLRNLSVFLNAKRHQLENSNFKW